ncbi:MAB_1171c family putative transporter [Streptomyces gobiensis]|uniref:MAB_1171c family putative transporter n=1 Tax=Streptomyces gobiensis TaxID=2875706 RepID=UPI001E471E98|nr:MAB_1171c family putative transporter [Streptomyces gobiensis]UGY92299.1 hypothetical protein test1122_11525 [Streptomyces gobiensis]
MSELSDFGRALEYPGILCLWIAVLVRLPSAVRSPQQRGLWLAVATAAAAMTLHLPATTDLIARLSGPVHLTALTRNMSGALSAVAVLYFVASSTSGRRLRTAVCVAGSVALGALLLLDATAPPHREHEIPATGDPVPSLAYWLTLMGAHLVANTVCVFICWRYGRRAQNRSLGLSLYLFGLGTALAGLFWLVYLLRITFGTGWAMPLMPLFMNLHALLRAAAILVPTFLTLSRATADIVTAWRLWPLWRDLVDAVPHVALTKPRRRTLEFLWPPVPRKLLIYRKVIETRDAILVLNDYVPPGTHALARDHVTEAGVPHSNIDAAVLACMMRAARSAKLAGRPQQPPATGSFSLDSGGLAGEKAFLLDMARAYASAPAAAFTITPTASESK